MAKESLLGYFCKLNLKQLEAATFLDQFHTLLHSPLEAGGGIPTRICRKVGLPHLQFKEASIAMCCDILFVKFRRCCLRWPFYAQDVKDIATCAE